MHRLHHHHLKSANHHLLPRLLTSNATVPNTTQFIRLSPLLKPIIAFVHSAPCRSMDPSPRSSPAINGDDYIHVDHGQGEGDDNRSISGESDSHNSQAGNEADNYDSSNNNYDNYERKILPPELSRSVVSLTCESSADGGTCDVYLVGTAHVSAESCREVQEVIDFLKPQVVFLELCSGRVAVLTPHNLKVPTFGEMVEMWKKNQNMFGIIYSWFLSRVASKLEVFPGAEFRVAYEEAMKYGGKVILGDRPVQITLRRTWAKMPLWHKTKLLYSILFQSFFLPSPVHLAKMLKDMDDVDMLTLVIQEMSKQFPTLMETLVHERDLYMSTTLLRIAREHNSVVAVVGKGHLAGIQKNWKQPVELTQLLSVPAQKPTIPVRKIFATVGVAVAGAAILSGLYISSKK